MEDDRECFYKWKTTLNSFVNGRRPQIFLQMEDDLKSLCKWKTTLNSFCFASGSRPQIVL
jgi:hypothetical protein